MLSLLYGPTHTFVHDYWKNHSFDYVEFCCQSDVSGFPGGSDGKESACNVGDLDLIPGLGRSPGGGHDNPLQYPFLENPHEQRNLVDYSPWGRKESDMTEH